MTDRNVLEGIAKDLIGYTEHKLGKGTGIALFVFDFGDLGSCAYVSNADREGMIRLVEEWLTRMKAGLFTDPPGPRAMG